MCRFCRSQIATQIEAAKAKRIGGQAALQRASERMEEVKASIAHKAEAVLAVDVSVKLNGRSMSGKLRLCRGRGHQAHPPSGE